jgi:hypothetical protein
MNWARMLAYITGTVDQELLLRNEYLAAENRILKAQIKGRLLLSEADKATLAEIALSLVTILSGCEINNFAGQSAIGSAITWLPCLPCSGSGSEPCFACFGRAAV